MSTAIRVIIYTSNEEYAAQLRHDLLGLTGVKIVAEIDDTILLAQAAERFSPDIVMVDLDPLAEEVLPVAGALAMERPDIDVFAVSQSTDGQLILSAMRAGIREFLTKPLDMDLVSIAFERVAHRKVNDRPDGRIITVIGSAGGVGASVVACNLAVELCDIVGAERVALVDLDYRFGQVATLLDANPGFTIADLAESDEQLEQAVVEKAMTRHDCGVHILARPHHFNQADMITAAHCAGVLQELQKLYDYIVIDGPSRFDLGSKAVLDIADVNLVLIQLLVTSVRNVHRIVSGMREAGFNLDRLKIVCNRFGKESGSVSPEYVTETLNHKIFHFLPDEWSTVSSAVNMGVPLIQDHHKTKIRLSIRELAERLHSPLDDADANQAAQKGMGGFLSKMFKG